MKLRQLQCILAVVQNGYSVTAASEALHMSQPAVSKQIKLFEDMLGMQVFKRNNKIFVGLTPLGDELLPEIDRILQSISNIRQLGELSHEAHFSQLHIATTNTLARYGLSSTMPYISINYPNMPLNVMEGTNTQILTWLNNQEVDFGWFSTMSLTPYLMQLHQLIYLPAMNWNLALVMPKSHPLAQSTPKSLVDIAKYPLITYITSHRGLSGLMLAMQEEKLAAKVVLTARNADIIKGYVRQGMGVGVIADIAYDSEKDSDLVVQTLSPWVGQVQTYLAWHKNKRLRNLHYDFIGQIVPNTSKQSIKSHIHRIKMGQEVEGWVI